MCGGLNDPPKTPRRKRLVRRRSRYCRRRGSADTKNLPIRWIGLAHRIAEIPSVILVADRLVRLVKPQIRVTSDLGSRMKTDDILEVDDRRVERLPLQVMDSGIVILRRKPLVELRHLLAHRRDQRRIGIIPEESLILGESILSILGIERGLPPHVLIRHSRGEKRIVGKRVLRKQLIDSAVRFRGEKMVAHLFLRLTEEEIRLRDARIAR